MPSMKEIRDEKNKLVGYRIRVCLGKTNDGHQMIKTTTYRFDPKLSVNTEKNNARKFAINYEEGLKAAKAQDKQKVSDYISYFLRLKEQSGIKKSTISFYRGLAERINAELGDKWMSEVRTQDINVFLENLAKNGTHKERKARARDALLQMMSSDNVSKAEMSRSSDLNINTVYAACSGKEIAFQTAVKIAAALQQPVESLFDEVVDSQPLSGKTRREYRRFLYLIFETAVDEEVVHVNPVRKAMKFKSATKESESLKMDEMRKTLEAAEEEPIKWKTMVHVMLAGGLRRGEALGLEWKNFDSAECTIKVEKTVLYKREFGVYYDTPKSNRGRREIILPPETVEILLDYKEWLDQTKQNAGPLWEENGLIFPNNTGRPMNPDSVTKWFHEFSERHDLPHIHPHMMRHTTASMLIQGQRDVYSVSSFMGHAKPSITMDIYSHEFSAYNEKNAAVIRDAIYPQKKKDES